jgi:hypothetical protein
MLSKPRLAAAPQRQVAAESAWPRPVNAKLERDAYRTMEYTSVDVEKQPKWITQDSWRHAVDVFGGREGSYSSMNRSHGLHT